MAGTTDSAPSNRPTPPAAAGSAPPAGDAAAPGRDRFPIVGLGASAGGLEAFEQFFRAMPTHSGMAFVVVQHLDPSHASILTEILQRSTSMPVVEAQDQMTVEPDRVHVIPQNRDMAIFNGTLHLSVPTEPRGLRMPIDAFPRSLAEDQGEDAVGVILSGTGTDGTLGLRAVFGAGGLCLVQAPASARFSGMPDSAINAGYATQVLPPEQMPQALCAVTRPRSTRNVAAPPSPTTAGGLGRILLLLRSSTGHDFSLYKKSALARRIERRMAQHAIEDAVVHARYLKENPSELQSLFRKLLINVTSFFRDPQAFAALKTDILPTLLSGKPDNYVLRIWVAGCATGEEAYSIAMLLRELMDEMRRDIKVQLYSTDLDDEAIIIARAGVYPPNIAQDVSPERLRRFFTKIDAGYRVKNDIREMVVFAVQSVIKDPPFTRLDLLACRNLMIHLEPELQNRLIPTFHYALKPGGVLFLSPSESVGNHTDLFELIDLRWKFHRARPSAASIRTVLAGGLLWASAGGDQTTSEHQLRSREPRYAELAKRALLQCFAPAAVVTDPQGIILYVHGETGKFLRPAPGQPSHSVIDMAREGLQLPLREALREVGSEGVPVVAREINVKTNGHFQAISLAVRSLHETETGGRVLLIIFQELPGTASPKPGRKPRRGSVAEAERTAELERELAYATERMKAMLEEQQASNEELKSTNEELQSTNEELQSTNEELETSKEELQSVNEELVTVNAELQTRIEQMAGMQDDMKNLLDNIRVGTIFLDRRLLIRRFTRDATQVCRLTASDVGRPLADIRSELQGGDLLTAAQTVLDSLVPVEREVCTASGTWYLARIQPYRTVEDLIDGVVLTFSDVTARLATIAAAKARDLAEAIVNTVRDPLIALDGSLQMLSANRTFRREFGGSAEVTVGQPFFEICGRQWDFPVLHDLLENVLLREFAFERREIEVQFPAKGARHLAISAHRIDDLAGELVLLVIEPVDGKAASAP